MTSVAFERRGRMRVAQLKLGAVVVKATLGGFPIALAVALRAILSKRLLMLVVFLVATEAVLGRLLEQRAFVALFALHFCVFPKEWERT